jgi:hypothetical protein
MIEMRNYLDPKRYVSLLIIESKNEALLLLLCNLYSPYVSFSSTFPSYP